MYTGPRLISYSCVTIPPYVLVKGICHAGPESQYRLPRIFAYLRICYAFIIIVREYPSSNHPHPLWICKSPEMPMLQSSFVSVAGYIIQEMPNLTRRLLSLILSLLSQSALVHSTQYHQPLLSFTQQSICTSSMADNTSPNRS